MKLNIISWTRTQSEDVLKLFGLIPIYSKIRNTKVDEDFQKDFEEYKSKVKIEESSEKPLLRHPGGVISQEIIERELNCQEEPPKILTISWANPEELKTSVLSNLINVMENEHILAHSLDGSITTVKGRDINTQMYLYEFIGRTGDFISKGYEFNVVGKNSSFLKNALERGGVLKVKQLYK